MFKNPPKILAHLSAVNKGNFVTPEFILNKDNNSINLFKRFCPHRMYPLSKPGEILDTITCNFHGFHWSKDGQPINNDMKLNCGSANIGRSNLIFQNFEEPEHQWVRDIEEEKHLEFSHAMQGTSNGSWLWMMDIQADLLHIRNGQDVIHPWLSTIENLDLVEMEEGLNWILQTCTTGWWLFIFPFTFIEWSKGCLAINYTVPKDKNNEFGFDWITQFYYDPCTTQDKRCLFEKLENVFQEDVSAIEAQKGPYFPLLKSQNRLEDHCVHWGKWVKNNRSSE